MSLLSKFTRKVKITMINEATANLSQMEGIVRNMYLDGTISEEKYQSQLISIAESYVLINDKYSVIELISRLSSKYLNEILPDALNSELLFDKAQTVANFLEELLKDVDPEDAKIDMML